MEDLDRMVRFATETGALERTVFIAMNWTLLDRMRSQDASIRIGYIVDEAGTADEAIERATGDQDAFIDFKAELLLGDPELARAARGRGIELGAWTVNDPANATTLLEMGVPRITTNEVEALVEWKRSL
jgi:glycerophosphoryl diester phosphodiesterase